MIWLALGIGGVLFRTVQLFFIKDVQTGLVWATKILTDPFHDIKLYHKAPLALLRGELIDPDIGLHRVGRGRRAEDAEESPRIQLQRCRFGGGPTRRHLRSGAEQNSR